MGLVLLDFDGTITQHDTLDALVSLAISHSPRRPNQDRDQDQDQNQDPPVSSRDELLLLAARWRAIVRDYLADYERHVAGYRPPAERRRTLAEERAFLESLGAVEARSVRRVSGSGLFAGLRGEDLEGLGREAVGIGIGRGSGRGTVSGSALGGGESSHGEGGAVRLRKGFGEFVERVAVEGGGSWDLAVVSVNWSGRFIKGVVEAGCGRGDRVARIVSNDVKWPGGQVEGPEELGGEPLVTAGDKLRAMRSLRGGLKEQKVVYFGDSTTDLTCLLEADFGLVMADDGDSKLLRTLRRIGFEVPHVGERGAESKLLWARDFDEVLQSRVIDQM
ncbi:hypothetical protein VTK56DRAFT_9325 [Thermocarpiscus australiensis]